MLPENGHKGTRRWSNGTASECYHGLIRRKELEETRPCISRWVPIHDVQFDCCLVEGDVLGSMWTFHIWFWAICSWLQTIDFALACLVRELKQVSRLAAARLKALKDNDYETYLKLALSTKQKRLKELMKKTDDIAVELGLKVSLPSSRIALTMSGKMIKLSRSWVVCSTSAKPSAASHTR